MQRIRFTFILLLLLIVPSIRAQTGPGNIQLTGEERMLNAVTANGSPATPFTSRQFGAVKVRLTITGTATVNFEGRMSSADTFSSRKAVKESDTSNTAITSTTSSGTYIVYLAGDEQFNPRVSGYSSGTVTAYVRGIPSTGHAIFEGGGSGGGGSGTVTSVSGVDANGFTFNIADPTTTPAITLTQQNAAADGSTKGIASFTADDFNSSSGNISLDYTNAQKATDSVPGLLSATDWARFDSKVSGPAGSDTHIQFNDGSVFGGSANFIFSKGNGSTTTAALGLTGTALSTASGANGNAATASLSVTGTAGQATSFSNNNSRGGNGAGVSIVAGVGGANSDSNTNSSLTHRGGLGGDLTVQAGAGGAGTDGTGVVRGGTGGAATLRGGIGGTAAHATAGTGGQFNGYAGGGGASASGVGGNGGIADLGGGDGGISSGAFASGNGGMADITGGIGGNNSTSGGTAGNGGDARLNAGQAGIASGGASAGVDGIVYIGNLTASAVNIGKSGITVKLSNLVTNGFVKTSGGDGTLSVDTNTYIVSGGALGTPSSGTLTNATGLPVGTGISGLGTGVATFLGTPSSANLASAVTDETGSGLLVFGTSPSLIGTVAISGATTTGPDVEVSITGDTFARVAMGINTTDVPRLSFGPGNAARDTFLERAGVATLRRGAPDAAAPVAQTDIVQNVVTGTSNTAGADRTFAGSQGTGTGAGGMIVFKTSTLGSAGSTQNALITRMTINSATSPSVNITGGLTVSGDVQSSGGDLVVSATREFYWGNRSVLKSTADGYVTASNFNENGFTSLKLYDVFLTRKTTANLSFGDVDAASPVAQTLSVQNVVAGTSNAAGLSFDIVGSLGTSTGAPGRVGLKAGALTPTSGTAQQTAIYRSIIGASKVLANNTTTTVTNVSVASNTASGGVLDYTIEVFDGTDVQVETGAVSFMVTNKGGVFTGNTTSKFGNQQNTTSGTLAVTFTITGANPALLQVNANSSLTPSSGYPRLVYAIRNQSASNDIAVQ